MGDFIGDNQCVTHFDACDCREAKFKAMEAELAEMKVERVCLHTWNDIAQYYETVCGCVAQTTRAKYCCFCGGLVKENSNGRANQTT